MQEKIGLIPRSILRTLDRFRKQLFPNQETKTITLQEFQVSRQQMQVSVVTFLTLVLVPLGVNICGKTFLVKPFTQFLWNNYQTELFLNQFQAQRAFTEMQEIEDVLFFDSLIQNTNFCFNCSKAWNNYFVMQPSSYSSNSNFVIQKPDLANSQSKNSTCHNSKLILQKNVFEIYKFSENTDFFKDKMYGEQIHDGVKNSYNEFSSKASNALSNLEAPLYLGSEASLPPKLKNFDSRIFTANQLNRDDKLIYMSLQEQPLVKKQNFLDKYQFAKHETQENVINKPEIYKIEGLLQTSEKDEMELRQDKLVALAIQYNEESIDAISNLIGDALTCITITFLFFGLKVQILILQSFLTESFYSLSNANRSLIIIIVTDLLVGYHSPQGWKLLTQLILQHYGFPETKLFILCFIGTFPVILDTIFKYWIFRHLNRISPTTVLTYHRMIE
uniref:Potassium/proton antiporter CemA n=1 Tax=Pleurastrum terricola TaxID=34116 RepID=CEMA_PLETE|nr:envelope membrane protein [Pleurastrum terricola]A6YG79.1 RecName: Full=Potassium/proton antiporter CemA; AltName: Full=Chloroplast envelope membrane protein A; Short=CemA [Pleurastrum terricola]ABO69299.1 chloroplast enveloppe membrane protein [Pleurastrum terricola]